MTEQNQAIADAMAVINEAKENVKLSADECLDQAIIIKELVGIQAIEIEKDGLVLSIKTKTQRSSSGGKGKKLIYEGKEFPSAKALCLFLDIEVGTDSAVRKLEQNKVEYTEV